jgi:hypothetical protein
VEADRVAKERAQAETARMRAEAEASAAKVRSEAKTAPASAPVVVASAAKPAAAGAGRFDGAWNVTLNCPRADNAQGYVSKFVAQVTNGYLKGDLGTEGSPGSLRLQGTIQPDGTATLEAKGLTGDPKYTIKGDKLGTPYGYSVVAEFEGARGTGRRIQLRACDLTFARQ